MFSMRLGYLVVAALLPLAAAHASTFSVLHQFNGEDGSLLLAGVIADGQGNLYGTTEFGGRTGGGTLFKLAPDGSLQVLHNFPDLRVLHKLHDLNDGANSAAGLVADQAGNLYGTTLRGQGSSQDGVVFRIAPDATESVLYAFDQRHGYAPQAGVILDPDGNLFGTTEGGGKYGAGTAFELTPDGTVTVLHAFTGGSDGGFSYAGLVADKAGNLYGTTVYGGDFNCDAAYGCGVVFKLIPNQKETVFHTFAGGNDGSYPLASLILDGAGDLYGTTQHGGSPYCSGYQTGCGTVFKLAPDGTETVLYAFKGVVSDGHFPSAGLVQDPAGNLYGTTYYGGDRDCGDYNSGCGTVFRLAPDGTKTVLHVFESTDGRDPTGTLLLDASGILYGTTFSGGSVSGSCPGGCGTVFKIEP